MRPDPAPYDEGFEVLAEPRWIPRRVQLVLLAVVVLVAAAAGVRWLTQRDPPVRITAYGQPVADPGAVLAAAQDRFEAYTTRRHGTLASGARCWFQRPPGSPDISGTLLCGPVLYYDGDPGAPYLRVPLVPHGTGTPVRLAAATPAASSAPVAPPRGTLLVRPEGAAHPVDTAGLTAPVPPSADADTLTATAAVHPADLVRAPASAVIGGDLTTVTLDSYGQVDDFGSGSAERSAPPGRQLFAFRLVFTGGENGFARLSTLHLGVSVGTAAPRPLELPYGGFPGSGALFVIAAPATAPLNLVLSEQGITQRLSLRDATPAPGNIAFLRAGRAVDAVPLGITVPETVTLAGHRPQHAPLYLSLDYARMQFFVAGSGAHPRSTDHVFLYVAVSYRLPMIPQNHQYAASMTLTPAGGKPLHPSVVPGADRPLFDVPADMSKATITLSGTEKHAAYILTMSTSLEFPIQLIPATD